MDSRAGQLLGRLEVQQHLWSITSLGEPVGASLAPFKILQVTRGHNGMSVTCAVVLECICEELGASAQQQANLKN